MRTMSAITFNSITDAKRFLIEHYEHNGQTKQIRQMALEDDWDTYNRLRKRLADNGAFVLVALSNTEKVMITEHKVSVLKEKGSQEWKRDPETCAHAGKLINHNLIGRATWKEK